MAIRPTCSWRPRFSLRSLLVLIAVFGLGCWVYTVGWPAYCKHRIGSVLRESGGMTLLPQGAGRLHIVAFDDPNLGRATITGKLVFCIGELKISADKASLWSKVVSGPDVMPPKTSHLIYVEGDVSIRADRMTYLKRRAP